MVFPALHRYAKENGLDFLSMLQRIDQHPFAVPADVREEAKDFLFRGNKFFAAEDTPDDQLERDAARRVEHFR